MTDKSNMPVSFYAIASLAALVIMPVLALSLSGTIGFFIVLGLVLVGILLTRSLFMTESRAFWLVASLSILTISGIWTIMHSGFPALVEWGNGMKNNWCVDGNIWCQLRDWPMPSETDRWWICGVITLAIMALNAIWFVSKAMSGKRPSGDISDTEISVGRDLNVPFGVGHGSYIGPNAGRQRQTGEAGGKAAPDKAPKGNITGTKISIGQDSNAPFVVGHGSVVDTSADKDSETVPAGKAE
jgi:hypothetical protein